MSRPLEASSTAPGMESDPGRGVATLRDLLGSETTRRHRFHLGSPGRPQDSVFGAGRQFGNVDRLVSIPASGSLPAGIPRIYGRGGWGLYEQTGGGSASPQGDSGVLSVDGTGWKYVAGDGKVTSFNGSGLQTRWLRSNGVESFVYDYVGCDLTGMTMVSTITGNCFFRTRDG